MESDTAPRLLLALNRRRLRWLVQHQLEGDHRSPVLTGDLQEPAAPPGRLPEALAIPAHVAPLGRALLLGDHLPGRNTGEDQAALRLPPEEVAVLVGARVVLLLPVLAHNGGHVAGREAWIARSHRS